MPTETIQKNKVFIVEGSNWKVRVPMDVDDLDMDLNDQLAEAATKGVEVFFGHIDNSTFSIPNPENPPLIGNALAIYDEAHALDESKYFFIPSHIPLANAGHYKESAEVFQILMENERVKQEEFVRLVGGPEQFEKLQSEADKLMQKQRESGKPLDEAALLKMSKKIASKLEKPKEKPEEKRIRATVKKAIKKSQQKNRKKSKG